MRLTPGGRPFFRSVPARFAHSPRDVRRNASGVVHRFRRRARGGALPRRGVVESATTFGSEAFSESDAGFFGDARDEGNPLKKRNTWFDDVPGTYETTIVPSPPAQVCSTTASGAWTRIGTAARNRDTTYVNGPRFLCRTTGRWRTWSARTTRRPETRCTRTWRCMIRRGSSACSRSTMASLRTPRGRGRKARRRSATRRSCSSSRSRGNVPRSRCFIRGRPTRRRRRELTGARASFADAGRHIVRGSALRGFPSASPDAELAVGAAVLPRGDHRRAVVVAAGDADGGAGQKNGGRAAGGNAVSFRRVGRVGHVLTIGLRFVARVGTRFVAVVVEDASVFRSDRVT